MDRSRCDTIRPGSGGDHESGEIVVLVSGKIVVLVRRSHQPGQVLAGVVYRDRLLDRGAHRGGHRFGSGLCPRLMAVPGEAILPAAPTLIAMIPGMIAGIAVSIKRLH